MTFGKVAAAALALSLLAGCAVRERTTIADPHRDWWAAHHARDPYDRARAEREHREYCARTYDRSCEGWR